MKTVALSDDMLVIICDALTLFLNEVENRSLLAGHQEEQRLFKKMSCIDQILSYLREI